MPQGDRFVARFVTLSSENSVVNRIEAYLVIFLREDDVDADVGSGGFKNNTRAVYRVIIEQCGTQV